MCDCAISKMESTDLHHQVRVNNVESSQVVKVPLVQQAVKHFVELAIVDVLFNSLRIEVY